MENQPIPSASLILLRDGAEGLELFMIRRNAGLRFAAGATVFPGGRVDPEDGAGAPGDDRTLRRAAIREAFEECGILLARGGVDAALLEVLRAPSPVPLAERLRLAGLEPAVEALVPFARWITPETVWRRFDTTFFLAPAPVGQVATVDGGEAVAGLWGTPAAILREAEAGRLSLVFATRMNLMRLSGCGSVAEALAAAHHQPLVPILPRRIDGPAGAVFRIPDGAGYALTEVAASDVRLG
ncbi:NUDIX hydrolase [Azospirillum soli]|uniref:NUDIX hydrolase n=1 Tax=Azospirillum soli TaxID=1304799 RepID=UPI001AE7E0D5|nr:NUDIX domain-containing protein [Azospirillum soli]MBP2314734.1 8-oxo-dGTP pyrophosphatase MutT (NUDIX family) [Azospirillum soli]